jgi:hypothetical protein
MNQGEKQTVKGTVNFKSLNDKFGIEEEKGI